MKTPFDDLPSALAGIEVLRDAASTKSFGFDHLRSRGVPGAVVRPRSTEQVAALMALSAERGFDVVTRAAGTNLCGSFIPRPDAVLLDMRAMDRVVSIDEDSRVATVEPGVLNGDLQRELAPRGLCWSPDPASRPISTIGIRVVAQLDVHSGRLHRDLGPLPGGILASDG